MTSRAEVMGPCQLVRGDCRAQQTVPEPGLVIIDPPFEWYARERWHWWDQADSRLVFCDPRNLGAAVFALGMPPAWCFTWDCMNTWQTGPNRPVQQAKHCLWYGELATYDRDGQLHGEPPAAKNHPTTKSTPAQGRRLTDVWRESLRWTHCEGASGGRPRWDTQGHALRHAKPVKWLECLIANTSPPGSPVLDPFMGSGAAAIACSNLGRPYVGIELDPEIYGVAVERLRQHRRQRRLFDD